MDKSIKITTSKQFEILTDFMIAHPSIAKGFKFGEFKEEYYKTWENLTKLLNSSGPPIKNMSAWQKVWTDYKLKLKKKLAHNKKELSGICNLAFLSSTEEQVIKTLDKIVPQNSVVFGLGTDIDINFSQPKTVNIEEQPKTVIIQQKPEQLQEVQQATSSRSKRLRLEFEHFRKKMLEEQTNTLKKIENHLENILHTLEKQQRLNKIKTDLEIEVLELKKTKLELQLSKMT